MFKINLQAFLTTVLLLYGIQAVKAQDTLRLSLNDARRMAMERNTNIINSKIDVKMAEKKIWETTAIGLPHIDGKGAYSYIPKVPTLPASVFGGGSDAPAEGQVIPLGVKHSITFDLTVSQLIFNGAYLVGLQASKAYHEFSKDNYEKSVLDINEAVNNTYLMIQVAEESRKILNQNLQNVEKTLYEINEMNKQGFVEKTDVDQLELTGNTIRNALNQIASNLDVSYRLLKIQLGIDEKVTVILADEIRSNDALTSSSNSLLNQVFNLDQNVDYKILATSESLARLDWKREKTNSLPVIAGFYNHQEIVNRPIFNFAPKDVFGINLSLPIFSSGQRSSAVFQKKLSLEKATNTKLYVANSTLMQATQLRNDLRLKLDKYQVQKKSMELADEIYNRTLEKYRQGVSSSMDLLTSQNQYLTNLTNYYQSIYDLEGAQTKLEKLYNINQEIKK
jgi:outer membrane protein TolC